ncbi:2-dehydro-3-deoxyphosphogluconate aldolase [Sporosarcina newyorkensis 2681]|uniref:2-dehydro-3-deoxyphosphogluconate aldolase n=1 Tax=Sporosarcina newyorkensis 2681 TaxID=1027292 RepID=F9DRR6_9BACL|nr:bifunctional 4-hydroxy-2-oxoglutarate aldolase/2-dehydro-3-deoxy-phosphogluconate aldolase [Sporosarcina newyorkensis]EGQ26469.1 2-dehydro-3-deoxyphosphogluconate aldolase [Sporosarcina newyorkensis 2681]
MTKQQVLAQLKHAGVVAVMRKMTPDRVIEIVEALKEGGVTAVEITVEGKGGMESIKVVKDHFGDALLVGAGTVLDNPTAKQAIEVGADFIVTPIVSKEVIQVANEKDCLIASGAMTPTEIYTAYQAGATIVKVFPADSLGPAYLKNIQGPLSHIPLMPTGGINLDNMGAYVKSGAICIGVGSAIYQYDTPEEIKKAAEAFVSAYRNAIE